MSQTTVAVNLETLDLNKLRALSRVDKCTIGAQIREAIQKYLQERDGEVQKELKAMEAELNVTLNSLGISLL